MSNSQQFDKYVKEQFSDYAPGVHPRIWENIAARNERKKPVGFWHSLNNNKNKLLLAGLLLALSTGIGWWYFNTPLAPGNKQAVSNKSGNADTKEKTLSNTLPSDGKKNTVEPEAISPALQSTPDMNAAVTSAGNISSAGGKSNISILSPSLQPDEEDILPGSAYSRAKKRKNTTGSLINMTTTAPGMDEEEYTTGGSLLGRLTYDAEKVFAKKKTKSPVSLSFEQILFLPDCPSIEKNASGNKKYLEIYAGPDYAFRSMSDTGNSDYLKKRKESTKFSSAYSAGIRYTKVFNNSMSVRAGVNYSQINEKFTFSQGNLVQITYIIGANGDTLGSYTTTGTRYKTTINKYRSVDVPIVMGYELGNGKWHANINAGVVVNIYSWQKGDVLDTAYQPVNITTGKAASPYQFKTNAGVGFIGGVSVYYKLNDRLHLMAEPYFRYNFSPMNKDNITLKQKYQTAGLRVGIRVDLK